MPFFSIIVPAYNVSAYLHACISSVLEQDFEDYELLLVDDGCSEDDTSAIAIQCAQSDNRIKIVSMSKGGLTDARNTGIDYATGEYLLFLDGDDNLADDCLRTVYQTLAQGKLIDILQCNYQIISTDGTNRGNYVDTEVFRQAAQTGNSRDFYCSMLDRSTIVWNVWSKIWRTDYLRQLDYHSVGVQSAEDVWFTTMYMMYGGNLGAINLPLVLYRYSRPDSLTALKTVSDRLNLLKSYHFCLHFADDPTISDAQKQIIIRYFSSHFTFVYTEFSYYKKEERKILFENATDVMTLLPLAHSLNTSHGVLLSLYRLFGVRRVDSLTGWLRRFVHCRFNPFLSRTINNASRFVRDRLS